MRSKQKQAVWDNLAFFRDIQLMRNGDLSMEELRNAYKYLYKLSKDRLYKLERADRANYDRVIEFKNSSDVLPPSAILNKTDLLYALRQTASFVSSSYSTVRGQKRVEAAKLMTLHENGYDFVNEDNIASFGEFMAWAREQLADAVDIGSDQVARVYDWMTKQRLSINNIKKDFEFFVRMEENGSLNKFYSGVNEETNVPFDAFDVRHDLGLIDDAKYQKHVLSRKKAW